MTISRRLVLAGAMMASLIGRAQAVERPSKGPKMRVKDVFVLICTPKLYECRDFYVKTFGFDVAFESSIYIQLHIDGEGSGPGFGLALMPPEQPFGPNFDKPFNGQGAYVTLEVADAASTFERVRTSGAPIVQPVRDEKWGQRHFVTRDPGGTIIDIVQTIDAAPGYYDRYKVTA